MRIERASTAYPFIVVSEVDEKAGVGEDAAPVVASDHRGVFVLHGYLVVDGDYRRW